VTVAESAAQADTRSVCVIRSTLGQYFYWQSIARVAGDSWACCQNCYYHLSDHI